jgi:glycosyltransferase involved in cell wall biosynthesis
MLRAAITLYPLIFGFWKLFRVIQYSTYVTADTGGENDEVSLIKRLPLYPLLRPIYAAHNYYNSICEANSFHYQEIAIPTHKLTTIPNGILLSDHQYRKPLQIRTFLFLGRLFVYKGIRDLLAAFKKYYKEYPDAKLIIGGVGPEASYVTKFIKNNQLEAAVEYLGLVANKDKEAFFARGDCLVLPSYSEGFPISILEAMKYNKAIITTDVSDLKTLFSDMLHFCDIRNSDDLYTTMKNLKKSYSPITLQYQKYLKNHDVKFIAKKIIALNT